VTTHLPAGEIITFIKVYGINIIAFTDKHVIRSDDFGENIEVDECELFPSISDAFVRDNGNLVVAAMPDFIETSDNGKSWKINIADYFIFPGMMTDKRIIFAQFDSTNIYSLMPDNSIIKLVASAPSENTASLTEINGYIYATTLGGEVWRMPVSTVGVKEETSSNSDFSISPNPVGDFVNIKFNIPFSEATEVSIYNSIGTNVAKQMIAGSDSQIDVSGLSDGIYFIKANINGKISNAKFVIAK
jgi:hypothetical protein